MLKPMVVSLIFCEMASYYVYFFWKSGWPMSSTASSNVINLFLPMRRRPSLDFQSGSNSIGCELLI